MAKNAQQIINQNNYQSKLFDLVFVLVPLFQSETKKKTSYSEV